MIMTLCLLVYNYAQYRVRKVLADEKTTVPNQVGKPIRNPTPRWLFQCMEGVAVVNVSVGGQMNSVVANINALRREIIRLFGPVSEKIYGFG